MLGKSAGAVMTRHTRALVRLRALLEDGDGSKEAQWGTPTAASAAAPVPAPAHKKGVKS